MASFDPSTIIVHPEIERNFWRVLRTVITSVFEVEEELAERYQLLLASASASERTLAMHDNPLEVAASLTASITDTHLERYRQLLTEVGERNIASETATTSTPITVKQLDNVLDRIGYRRVLVDESRPFLQWILDEHESLQFPRLLTFGTPQYTTDRTPDLVYDRTEVLDFLVAVYGDAKRLGASEDEAVPILHARQELQLAS